MGFSFLCPNCGYKMTIENVESIVVCNACKSQFSIKKPSEPKKELSKTEQILMQIYKDKYEKNGMSVSSFFNNKTLQERELKLYNQKQDEIFDSIKQSLSKDYTKNGVDGYEHFGIKRPAAPEQPPKTNKDFVIEDGKLVKITGQTATNQHIDVPHGVTIIAGGFKGLTCFSVDLPRSVVTIQSMAFSGCDKIYKIDLKKGVKEIGANAFANCTALTDFYIPTSVESVGKSAFAGLTKNQTIYVYKNQVKNWDKNWKKGCKAVIEIYD